MANVTTASVATEPIPTPRVTSSRVFPQDLEWQFVQPMIDAKQISYELVPHLEYSDGLGYWGGINWSRSLTVKIRAKEAGQDKPRSHPSSKFDVVPTATMYVVGAVPPRCVFMVLNSVRQAC